MTTMTTKVTTSVPASNWPVGCVLRSKYSLRISSACGVNDVRRLRFLDGTRPMKSHKFCAPFLYRSSAIAIHCSSTGLIFWALFGVMSSFSNLQQQQRHHHRHHELSSKSPPWCTPFLISVGRHTSATLRNPTEKNLAIPLQPTQLLSRGHGPSSVKCAFLVCSQSILKTRGPIHRRS